MNSPSEIDKYTRTALFRKKLDGKAVRCELCPHNCIIHQEKTGICKVRINHQGELFTTTYGNPCSLSIDPIEKKPLFHFLPGIDIFSMATAGCNFRCLNCQNYRISQTTPDQIQHYDLTPENAVQQALLNNTKSIAFTYTEPTVFYEYMLETAKIAHQKGIKIVIVSNGYINKEPLLELSKYIDAANIDLKCFDDKIYRQLTGGSLQPVLDTLITLKERKVWLEITNLLIPEYSESKEKIEKLCKWLMENGFEETPLHFSRFFPTYKLTSISPTTASTLIAAKEIAENSGLKYVYIGNLPGLHGENTICPHCKKMLIERRAYEIMKNIISDGLCGFCGELIAGIWQ
ncbi:MAG: AmmeMemoRadiSam system radical SAM enzyme [Paludibacter sp.]|nr:AmmeMemoRadiSam system radical SAM enzyme [Paludibacter sp.]